MMKNLISIAILVTFVVSLESQFPIPEGQERMLSGMKGTVDQPQRYYLDFRVNEKNVIRFLGKFYKGVTFGKICWLSLLEICLY